MKNPNPRTQKILFRVWEAGCILVYTNVPELFGSRLSRRDDGGL